MTSSCQVEPARRKRVHLPDHTSKTQQLNTQLKNKECKLIIRTPNKGLNKPTNSTNNKTNSNHNTVSNDLNPITLNNKDLSRIILKRLKTKEPLRMTLRLTLQVTWRRLEHRIYALKRTMTML